MHVWTTCTNETLCWVWKTGCGKLTTMPGSQFNWKEHKKICVSSLWVPRRRCWFFFTTMICWLIWSKKEGVAFKTVGAGEGLDEHDTVSALPWYTFLYLLLQSYHRCWSYPPELFAALSYSYSWSCLVTCTQYISIKSMHGVLKTRKILSPP